MCIIGWHLTTGKHSVVDNPTPAPLSMRFKLSSTAASFFFGLLNAAVFDAHPILHLGLHPTDRMCVSSVLSPTALSQQRRREGLVHAILVLLLCLYSAIMSHMGSKIRSISSLGNVTQESRSIFSAFDMQMRHFIMINETMGQTPSNQPQHLANHTDSLCVL